MGELITNPNTQEISSQIKLQSERVSQDVRIAPLTPCDLQEAIESFKGWTSLCPDQEASVALNSIVSGQLEARARLNYHTARY
jgi:hypothetical protein